MIKEIGECETELKLKLKLPNSDIIKCRDQTHRPLFKVKDFMSFQEPLWISHSAKSLSHLLEHFVTSHLDGK